MRITITGRGFLLAHDVFISYSSIDGTVANAVCEYLEGNGVPCWIAPRDINPGMDWGEAIIDAINGCKIMVLVFSSNANQSNQIKREVERAVSKGVTIVPLRIQNVAPVKSLEYFIGPLHWLEATTLPIESYLQPLAETVFRILRDLKSDFHIPKPGPYYIPPKTSRNQLFIIAAALLLLAGLVTLVLLTVYPSLKRRVQDSGVISKQTVPDKAEAYYQDGLRQFEAGDYKSAIANFDKAIQIDPKREKAYNNRGKAYYKMGQYESAIQDYDQTVQLNPQNAQAFNDRGLAYSSSGNQQKAIDDYTKAINLKPDLADAYSNRAQAYKTQGNYKSALQDYNESIKRNPNQAAAFYDRGISQSKLGQNRQAVSDFNEAIRLNPGYAAAYNGRGLSYQSLKNYPQAITDFSQAITLDPKFAEAYCNRGALYLSQGRALEATSDFDHCGKMDPGWDQWIQKKTKEAAAKKGKSMLKKLSDKLKKIF